MTQAIHLLRVGEGVELALLDQLAAGLARVFEVSCHVRDQTIDAAHALDRRRNQFYSTALLESLVKLNPPPDIRLLGVSAVDLFVPVLTFVFGEAQLHGNCAVVSVHRLRDEFYGLPPAEQSFEERLLKEAAHELGHTFGLRHCSNWECVMSSSHGVEALDIKGNDFCADCRRSIPARTPAP